LKSAIKENIEYRFVEQFLLLPVSASSQLSEIRKMPLTSERISSFKDEREATVK
jgi:hypothetical protein